MEHARKNEETVPVLSAERVAKKLFPNRDSSDRHPFNKLMSELGIHVLDFLGIQEAKKQELERFFTELTVLHNRPELYDLFIKKQADWENESVERPVGLLSPVLHIRSELLRATHPSVNRIEEGKGILDKIEEQSNIFHYLFGLFLYCNRWTLWRGYKGEPPGSALPILEQANKYRGRLALFDIYYSLVELLEFGEKDIHYFDIAFLKLKEAHSSIQLQEKMELTRHLINYSVIASPQIGGIPQFNRLMELYDFAELVGCIESTKASEEWFMTIGIILSRTINLDSGDTQDTRFDQLFSKSTHWLPDNRRSEGVALVTAYRNFYLGNYHETFSGLNRDVHSRLPNYALRFHSLNVRAAYELFFDGQKIEHLSLIHTLNAFNSYLNSPKLPISTSQVTGYKNMLYFIRKMANYVRDKKAKRILLEQLEKRKPNMLQWVRKKIDELPE